MIDSNANMPEPQSWTDGHYEPTSGGRIEQYAAEAAQISRTVARHYAAALAVADGEYDSAQQAYGSPAWAEAKWHLHVAQALEGLARHDHDQAMQFLRTKAIDALAGPAGKGAL